MIGQTISHYRILDKLGEGGMGVVYLAEDTLLGRRVAIKFPTAASEESNFRGRFLREARSISALSHPHIATVHDYGETADGQPYIVMELVTGEDLSVLVRTGRLSLRRILEIISDVVDALAEAHAAGIVHRDIKPSNVMINERGKVKVLDFGLAKQIECATQTGELSDAEREARTLLATGTQTGTVIGTPLYLSPEQAAGRPVDARSDIFALGALLYECISGRPPFIGSNALDICAQVLYVDPPPPSQHNARLPAELDRIALKALAKKPEARYQTAADLNADLRAVLSSLAEEGDAAPTRLLKTPVLPPGAGASRSASPSGLAGTFSNILPRRRFSRLFILLVALLAAGAGAWGVARWWQGRRVHTPPPEAERWYRDGERALHEGAYYKASKMLENAVQIDDRFALAHSRLAEALLELDYDERAKEEVIRAQSLVPDASRLPRVSSLYLQAVQDTVLRNFAGAIENYKKLTEAVPEAEKPFAFVDLGRAYEKNENFEQAIQSYAEAARRDPRSAAAQLRLAVLYGRKNELANASAAFERADKLYRDSSNFEGLAEVFYQRGQMAQKASQTAEARAFFEQALDMTRTVDSLHQRIKALLGLSNVAAIEGNTARAQEYAAQAVELGRANGLENLSSRGLISLGNAFFLRGELKEAEDYFQQALEFAQRARARRNMAAAQLSLGSLRIQQGEFEEGLRFVEQAAPFYREGRYYKELTSVQGLIGHANRNRGRYDVALAAFTEQLRAAEETGNQAQVARSHLDLGIVYADLERVGEALGEFEQSYAMYTSQKNLLMAGFSQINRAEVLWRVGRNRDAQAAADDVEQLASRPDINSKELRALALVNEAQLSLSERRFGEAIRKSEQALALGLTENKNISVDAKSILGLAEASTGAKERGRSICAEAVELATRADNPQLISTALLAQAEALLETGDFEGARRAALGLQQTSVRTGQHEKQWRAYFLAGLASQRLGDEPAAREHLSRARRLLDELQSKWGDVALSYLARTDIQSYRRALEQFFSAG